MLETEGDLLLQSRQESFPTSNPGYYLDYFNLSQESSNGCSSDLVFMLRATPYVLQNPLVRNHFEIPEPL